MTFAMHEMRQERLREARETKRGCAKLNSEADQL